MIQLFLVWLAYELLRPKAVWLFHYLVKKGEGSEKKDIALKEVDSEPKVKKTKRNSHLCKPIIQMTLEGEFVKEYPSSREASRQTGFTQSWIAICANGGRLLKTNKSMVWISVSTYKGYIWKWKVNQSL